MNEERVWTNSPFGRAVCTAFGVLVVGMSFTEAPSSGPRPWHGTQILVDLAICLVGVVVVAAVWTSRLELRDGTLTATNFFRSRSIPLSEVVRVSWSTFAFCGGKLRRKDGSGIRTLVSGTTWDELWTPRATKIEREILELAELARGGRVPQVGVPHSHRRVASPGIEPGARFRLVRLREGYDIREVDAFIAQVAAGAVNGLQAQDVRFRPVRLRQGYDMGEVDDYVDAIATQLPTASR